MKIEKSDYLAVVFDNQSTVVDQIWLKNKTQDAAFEQANNKICGLPSGYTWRLFQYGKIIPNEKYYSWKYS